MEGDKTNTGVYFCRALYNTQTGLIAGSIDSAKATVTVAGKVELTFQAFNYLIIECKLYNFSRFCEVVSWII